MKVEYNQNEAVPAKKKRKRKKSKNRIFAAITVILLVIAVTVTLMLTVLFNVNEVKVVGSSIYTESEIIYASGIMDGDNLIRLSKEDIAARIEEALPYVKKATVKKSYPSTVGIEVKPADEAFVVETADGMFVCDAEYKVLRKVGERPENIIKVKGIKCDPLTTGKAISFTDKQQRDVLAELLSICRDKGFNVTYVNIEKLVNISFAIGDELYVKLGSYTEMNAKLKHLEGMLKSMDDNVTASISLELWTSTGKEAVLKYEDISEFIK